MDRFQINTRLRMAAFIDQFTADAATARAVAVLADVFKRADQPAGDLAEFADQARARALTCEQACISLGEN